MFVAVIMVMNLFVVTAFAATTMGYYAAATSSSSTYGDNDPINRVFYIKTGSSSASRTLNFQQSAGEISYYMKSNTTKTCMEKYRISMYNDDAKKFEGTYYWNWSKSTTIKLDKKNTNYIVFVYPEDFDTVLDKYLTTKILKLRPIVYGYTKSPYFTITTSARISYSERDSIKIAGV